MTHDTVSVTIGSVTCIGVIKESGPEAAEGMFAKMWAVAKTLSSVNDKPACYIFGGHAAEYGDLKPIRYIDVDIK